MAETKAKTKQLYQLRGDHPRRENGKVVKPGEKTDLSHLDSETIQFLTRIGIYKVAKNG